MPMFQRKHYEVIADCIRLEMARDLTEAEREIGTRLASRIATVLARDNPNFSATRFFQASLPDMVGPKLSFSLEEIEAAKATVKVLRRTKKGFSAVIGKA